ncbi:TP901 family phage tail tape measure protein [Comamonas odontotermitis]|uniref:TP901 family phage tail tape measure protein n=1 Tax=Comamonas odontotermitis TaxID=379895 RepID=A0ABR6RJN2_9BURK|nr:phage tail tape measure protein [Comamonas odontotermitis]MBB6579381.1 TP901 family phage tail tape measure protein [Comamonas odontotermitis]
MADKLRLEVLLAAVDKVTGPLKAIQTGSRATAKTLGEAELALKKLQQQQRLLQRLDDAKPDLIRERDKLRMLKEQLSAMRVQGIASKKQLDSKEKEVAQQAAAYERQRAAAMRLRSEVTALGLGSASQAQAKLATSIGAANTQIDAQRHKLEQQRQVETRLAALREKHGATMMKLAKWGGAAVGAQMAGQKMSGWVKHPVQEFADAEQARTQLQVAFMTKDGGASAELQQITDLAQRLGDRLPGTTSDFINMMTALKKEGMSAKTILGGLGEASAYLAVMLEETPTEAAKFGAKMQDALQATESEMMGILDMLQRSHYAGADARYMLAGFGNMAPVLNIIKKKGMEAMKTLSPMMVMMNQAGMTDGGSAGNAIRKVYQYTMDAKKLAKANEAVKKAGGKFRLDFSDGKGEFGGLENMFSQLERLKNFNTMQRGSIIKELFGDDAETLRVLNQFIEKGLTGYQETVVKLQDQADLQERVNKLLGTLKNVAEAAQGSFTNLLVDLGELIAPEAKAVLNWLGDMAVSMKAWVKENPQVAKTLMLIAAGGAALLTVLGTLGIALVGMIGSLAMLRLLSGRMLLNLLGMRAAGASAAASTGIAAKGVQWLVSAWGAFKALGMAGIFRAIGPAITGALSQLSSLRGVFGLLKGGLWGLLKLVFAFARANPVAAVVMGIAGAVAGFVAHWDKIKEFWDKGQWWSLAKEIWAAIEWGLNAASLGLYDFFMTMAKKALGAVWEGMKSAVGAGSTAADDSPVQVAGRAKATAAAFALATGATAGPSVGAQALQDGQQFQVKQELLTLQPKAAAPVSVSSNNTFNITAAPGMDERAVARAITFEMDRRDRQTAARRGSSLMDID